jgi:hypothetical protein
MSDKHIPHYLRDINSPPSYLNVQQQQILVRTAKKAKKNHQLQQQDPSFVVPASIYKVIFINKHMSIETMQMLIDHVQKCDEYTLDTESKKSTGQLALIQIQTIPHQLPLFVILLELTYLPPIETSIDAMIKLFFQVIFKSGNNLYS